MKNSRIRFLACFDQTLLSNYNTYFHTHQIVDYVRSEFQVTYTVAGMNKWLDHNGFSYK